MPRNSWALRSLARAARPSISLACSTSTLALLAFCSPIQAQTALPPIVVEAPKPAPKQPTPAPQANAAAQPTTPAVTQGEPTGFPGGGARSGALTVPTTKEAIKELATVPGTVTVVTDAYKDTTPAKNIKDALDYVPGIFAQTKWGDDTRLSVRGSGLARNFHLRGLNLYMDGIPINTADGFGDFQELDPTAYRYIEIYKGANGQRFGSSTLGGAINFVTPTGRDADPFATSVDMGSFGFKRLQSSVAGESGPYDFFVTGSAQEQEGFRDHSEGDAERLHANLGIRISPDVETRFYLNANRVRNEIPGSVSKESALSSPTTAAPDNLTLDQQRNIDTVRFANKTTMQVAPGTVVEIGAFALDRHLMHPIFQWLDYTYFDYGGFARVMNESTIGGYKNRLFVGINQHNGVTDADQYFNNRGEKGELLSSSDNTETNTTAYIENAFYFLPKVALVAGTQFFHATRELDDKFLSNGDQSGENDFTTWNPKAGLLWEVDPTWQIYANVARSAEAPSFGENSDPSGAFRAELQTAVTWEIGTRGRRPDYSWDLAFYRANLDNELFCITSPQNPSSCSVQNADKTIHQGVEIGFGASVLKGLLDDRNQPDRLWLNLAYTYNDFHYDNDAQFGDNELPGAPRHFIRAELLYKHPSGFYFGPNIEWVPEAYYVDSKNTTDTESYILLGLKGGYEAENGMAFYIEARNLTDEAYIASTSVAFDATRDSALFEPGSGRSVYAGVKYRW